MKTVTILTSRERQIVENLQKGLLDKEIANELFIACETVKRHNKNIYKKLKVRNRIELVMLISRSRE